MTCVDVVIVGGGAAGIGAARRISRSKYSSLLLEAEDRLGGRAWTSKLAGLDLDIGCGWFHSAERNAWVAMAEAAGVPIDRRVPQWGIQHRDLGFTKAEQEAAGRAFGSWMQRLEHSPPASDNAADALQPGCEWNDYIRAIVGFISGGSLERLSIADYLAYDAASSENNWRSPRGFGALVASSFPSQVPLRLSTRVSSVALERDRVSIATPAGVVLARTAILTFSTAVLAGDSIALPAAVAPWREAARQLPLGRVEKIYLQIIGDAPFVPESQALGDPRNVRTASYYIRPLGAPVIECFLGCEGAKFLEEQGPAAGFDFVLGQLCTLFGSSVRATLKPLFASNWRQMSGIGGSYSYALPGQASARQALARPFDDRLFFAGEATSAGDFSTAHGAHDSGVRAAEEAISAMS